jgi:transposase
MDTPSQSDNPHAKRYPESFKREALTLLQSGRGLAQVARELGVSTWTLRQWQKRDSAHSAPSDACQSKADPNTAALLAEVATLRKQLARSELREDILKKALSILGQDPTSASK